MPDKVQKYVHSADRTGEWFWYARAYFDAAKHLALAYESGGDANRHLIIPLIFNLRHALELLLKFLAYGIGTAENINHHDIHRIFSGMSGALDTVSEASLEFAAEGLGVEKELISKALRIMTEKVEEATSKYYSYGFLTDDHEPIDDSANVLFRYPSSTKEKARFDPEELKRKVPAAEILKDIDLLSNFAWTIYVTFGKNENGLHVLKGLEETEARGKEAAGSAPHDA